MFQEIMEYVADAGKTAATCGAKILQAVRLYKPARVYGRDTGILF